MRSISAVGWKWAYDAPVTQQAEYFDGQSAARCAVTLRFDALGLEITGLGITGDGVSRLWPYDDIRYASEDSSDLPL
ncbi:MAG: hypothetical protein HOK82_03450, partial [Rhodospirillaceae bacterium]|nr:hypothetical protein [Rhodospirillaceae bacterium]